MADVQSSEVQALIRRVQKLADTPRPADGYSVAWQVEAYHLGDATALAVAALRSPKSG